MLNQSRLVYIGSGIALSVVLFIGGLLIGRFAIPRPGDSTSSTDESINNRSTNDDDYNKTWNDWKRTFLDSVSAEEIEKNLQ